MRFTQRILWVGLFILVSVYGWMAPRQVPADDRRVETPLQEIPLTWDENTTGLASSSGRLSISERIPGIQGNINSQSITIGSAGTQPANSMDWSIGYRFSSYEMDLMDASGDSAVVYLHEESNIHPARISVGNLYQMTGILELNNTPWQYKPGFAFDLVEEFPNPLMLEMVAPNSIASGEFITYTITAHNYTPEVMHNVIITATIPQPPASLSKILSDGSLVGAEIVWEVPELAPLGGTAVVQFSSRTGEQNRVDMMPAKVTADAYTFVVTSDPWMTFVDNDISSWTVLGDRFNSPFVGGEMTTEESTTEISQEHQVSLMTAMEPDNNPATLEGLSVLAPYEYLPVTTGDNISVTGRINEISRQTQLSQLDLNNEAVLSFEVPLPNAQVLKPPLESDLAKPYFGSPEEMLVQLTEAAHEINPFIQNGEYTLGAQSWEIEQMILADSNDNMIIIDDGSEITNYVPLTLTDEVPLIEPAVPHGPSKIGTHAIFEGGTLDFVRQVTAGGGHVALVKGLSFGYLCEVKDISPETVTIGRWSDTYYEALQTSGDPAAKAAHYMNVHMQHWSAYRDCVDYWEILNEVDPPEIAGHMWLSEFFIACMDIADANGYKLALFSYSMGVPEIYEWRAIAETGVFARAQQGGHILSLHEYSWFEAPMDALWGQPLPTYRGQDPNDPVLPWYADRGILTGRYRHLYRDILIPRGEVIPLAITEANLMIYDRSKRDPMFLDAMAWYDDRLREDDYVIGMAIFTLGGGSGWDTFDYFSFLPALAERVIQLKDE